MADPTVDFRPFNSKVDELINALNKNTEAAAKPSGTGGTPDASKNQKFAAEALKKFGVSLAELGNSAVSLASKLGVTAVRGVELELAARTNAAAQFVTLGANIAASSEQIKAVYAASSDAFVNFPAGMTANTEASAKLGLTTSEQLEQFKIATGRAGFSGTQLDKVLSRNIPSLLIFGQGAARSAINLDRIGVSLEQYRSVQQGVVTNLEGTLDTVNQLNQLGASIDFSTFVRISELEGPEAAFRYLDQNIPDALLKTSTSFRALTEQLPGVKVEDLLKQGGIDTFEERLAESAKPDGPIDLFTKTLIKATRGIQEATGVPGGSLAVDVAKKVGVGIASLGVGYFLGPQAGLATATILGNDVVSSYGDRTLVTPKGNIALNNNDTVIAGTNLMPRGSVQMADNSALMSKIDRFIDTVSSATTTINVDGTQRTVPRMSLVGVYSRNERA
jgi:hypothetical protein